MIMKWHIIRNASKSIEINASIKHVYTETWDAQ